MRIARRQTAASATLLAVALLGACGGAAPPLGPHPLFELPAAGALPDMALLPYPCGLFRGPKGQFVAQPSLGLPAGADSSAVALLTDALAADDGSGLTEAVEFPVALPPSDAGTGAIDPTSFTAANARLVDLATDPADPTHGMTLPVVVHARLGDGALVVRPAPGVLFRAGGSYGVVLLAPVRDVQGTPLVADADLAELLAGGGPANVQALFAPLLAWLRSAGIEPSQVIAATVFTTHTPAIDLTRIAQQVAAATPPGATLTHYYGSAALDGLFGTPTGTSLGLDNPGGVLHSHVGGVLMGTFPSPNYASSATGVTSVLGRFDHDSSGAPLVKAMATVPFSLVLPAGAGPANLPAIVYTHGLNSDRTNLYSIADTLCAKGYAVIGIDLPFHGSRRPGAVDLVNNITGQKTPDGVGDPAGFAPSLDFFDIRGDARQKPPIPALDFQVTRDTLRQAAVDLMALGRLVRAGDLSALAAADPTLAGLSLRHDRLLYSGESFGSITGGMAFPLDRDYDAAFLVVPGGGMLVPLLEDSPSFSPLFLPILAGPFGYVSADIDPLVDPPELNHAIALVQSILDAGDPLAYAPLVATPPAGVAPRSLVLAEAFADETVPNQATEALAAAMSLPVIASSCKGSATHSSFLADGPAAPVAGNVLVAGSAVTRALVQLDPASHGMLDTLHGSRKYVAGFPPFQPMPTVTFDNPIAPLQTLLATFADGVYAAVPPTLADACR